MEDKVVVALTAMTIFTVILLVIVIVDFFKMLKAIRDYERVVDLCRKEEEAAEAHRLERKQKPRYMQ